MSAKFNQMQPVSIERQADAVPAIPRSLPTTPYWGYSDSAALQTVFTPAQNTHGAIVFGNGGRQNVASVRVMAKDSAPSSWVDSLALTLGMNVNGPIFDGPSWLFVPAGYGLYVQASNASNWGVSMSYELLGE